MNLTPGAKNRLTFEAPIIKHGTVYGVELRCQGTPVDLFMRPSFEAAKELTDKVLGILNHQLPSVRIDAYDFLPCFDGTGTHVATIRVGSGRVELEADHQLLLETQIKKVAYNLAVATRFRGIHFERVIGGNLTLGGWRYV